MVRYADQPEVDPTWVVHDVATGAEEQLPIDLPLVDDPDPPYPDYSEWEYATDPTLSPDGELPPMLWRTTTTTRYPGRSDTLHVASLDGSRIRKLLPSADGVRRLEPDWRAIN